MGINIEEKMEMSCANTLIAAFVTQMRNESCRVSHRGWGGDGQGDTAEPTAPPVLVASGPFYGVGARDGEPRHSLLSAGGRSASSRAY